MISAAARSGWETIATWLDGTSTVVAPMRSANRFGKSSERLALIQRKGGDVDDADDVRRVCAERGNDVTAVRVASEDRRTLLQRQYLPQAGNIVGYRGSGTGAP